MRRALTIVIVFVLLSNTASAQEKKARETKKNYPPEFEDAKAEVYKSAGGTDLKAYIFNPSKLQPGDKRPAIVFFFGGGWNNGSPGQFQYQCRYLASRGMVAITADYRVKSRNNVA
ncbi:MAG TPA: hypothetical protein VHV77_05170, partial [Pirellulales bacterium]|nr:hypothetical protein [Pirellulales bacterium]